MGLALTKTPSKLLFGLITALFLLLALGARADAATTRPNLKVNGGDIFVGGAYISDGGCKVDANYQSAASGDINKGAILSFALYSNLADATTGSTAEYGALALGTIEGPTGGNLHGFGTYNAGNSYNRLSFANTTFWGGLYEGSQQPVKHCIPDYYGYLDDTSAKDLPASAGGVLSDIDLGGGQFKYDTGAASVAKLQIHPNKLISHNGQSTSIFVNGDVWITGNIVYADRSGLTDSNTPKFALVVKGNIYIDPSVSELDGWYIAQPDNDPGNSGIIWTCHNGSSAPAPAFLAGCTNQLVVNGSFYARHINLLRVTPSSDVGNNVAAESVNYTPDMVTGQSFFNTTQGDGGNFSIDSVVSLPPIY